MHWFPLSLAVWAFVLAAALIVIGVLILVVETDRPKKTATVEHLAESGKTETAK